MRVIVAGGRDYKDRSHVFEVLDRFEDKISVVVSGGANGVDSIGESWGLLKEKVIHKFPAQWSKHGKAAGPIRNEQMAQVADAIVLFPGGRGTQNMRNLAIKYGLIFLHDEV